MHERLSVVLIEALTRVWSRIRVHHPGVPSVMLLAAPSQRGDLSVLGHFAPLRWRHKTRGDTGYHEVVVVAEHSLTLPHRTMPAQTSGNCGIVLAVQATSSSTTPSTASPSSAPACASRWSA